MTIWFRLVGKTMSNGMLGFGLGSGETSKNAATLALAGPRKLSLGVTGNDLSKREGTGTSDDPAEALQHSPVYASSAARRHDADA